MKSRRALPPDQTIYAAAIYQSLPADSREDEASSARCGVRRSGRSLLMAPARKPGSWHSPPGPALQPIAERKRVRTYALSESD